MRAWFGASPMAKALVAAASAGCIVVDSPFTETSMPTTPEPSAGRVELSWQVGASSCEAAGVSEVEIHLGDTSESFPCADLEGVITVAPGIYDVEALGYDADGVARYGGRAAGVAVRDGDVTPGPTILLSSLPAVISTAWYFDNGRLCSWNGVSILDITLFDLGDNVEAHVQAPCDDGGALVGQVEAGDYVLVLLGLDDAGAASWRGEAPASVTRGESAVVEVPLAPLPTE